VIDYAATFTNYTGSFPNIEAQNVTAPGAGDGTEFVAALVNDIWGRAQALLDYAGLTPDGVQEAPDTAQILTALSKGYGIGPGIGVIYWKNGTPAANGDRVILLQGQVITIASYPLLAAAVYVGDANNATAPAFYKTSDAGGTTRSTSGTYMVMPDTRAVSLKGVGNQTINTRVKTGPSNLGALQEDQMQRLIGTLGQNHTGNYGTFSSGSCDGVFRVGSDNSSRPLSEPSTATYSALSGYANFDTAFASDSRVSSTTAGQTRDCTIGTNFGITY
jgi:hypothetical protein